MANAYKVLGQSAPSAATNTDLYTVPSSTSAVCSTLVICNSGSNAATFRVAIRPAGATLATQHYIIYNNGLATQESMFLTIGISLAATDVVTVYASSADLSFSLFGTEIT
jgi:hypothetical protein